MPRFTFLVRDSEGLWGDLRMSGRTLEEAQRRAASWLRKNEVRPNGSLLAVFTLTHDAEVPA